MKNSVTRLACASLLLIIWGSSCKKVTYETVINQDSSSHSKHWQNADTSGGYILLSPYNSANPKDSGTVMVLNGSGQLLMQKRTTGAAMNFKRWVINGQVRYTWAVYDINSYTIPVINQLTAYAVIADENLNEIKRVTLLPYKSVSVDKKEGIDVHDFILLADNHYITITYYQRTVTNLPASLTPSGYAQVVSPVIQEINNDQVTWQWDGSEHAEFYTTSVEGNSFGITATPQDYMHMNSIIIDPRDNNFICSFRNLNQVLKIDHTTGDIVWRLGGNNSDFPLTDDQKFLRQHNATLVDNNQTLLIFDNGEATERPYTRIVEFQLDEINKKVNGFKSFNVPEDFTQFMGSVQKIKSHYFIGGGTAKYYLDVNYLSGEKTTEVKLSQPSYRTFRYY